MYFVYIMGPAGSGKSYLTQVLWNWLQDHGLDAITINLDPAVSWLPYEPSIDIREYITVEEVMKKYNLGPNGGLVAAIDLSIEYIDKIIDEIESMKPNYVIIDTPGQMEIFAFRSSGSTIISAISGKNKSVVLFLIESLQAVRPSIFMSLLILSLSVLFSHKLPQLLVLTKCDLISKENLEKIRKWFEEPVLITSSISRNESIYSTLYSDAVDIIENIARRFIQDIIFTSAVSGEGIDELYAAIQRVVAGGEDFYTEEYSEVL